MSQSTPLSTSFSSAFTQNSKKRGIAYKNAGKVSITMGTGSSVRARVTGTDMYKVEVAIRPDGLFLSCTCPFYEDDLEPCKHIWATILQAESEGSLDDDEEPIP